MKQTEQKHSKEPWGVKGGREIRSYADIEHPLGYHVASTFENSNGTQDSERIVSCVNSLAGLNPAGVRELVEAAESALRLNEDPQTFQDDSTKLVSEMLRAALKKIKGDA